MVDSKVVYSTESQTTEWIESGIIFTFAKSKNVGLWYNRLWFHFSLDPFGLKGETLGLARVVEGRGWKRMRSTSFLRAKIVLQNMEEGGVSRVCVLLRTKGTLAKGDGGGWNDLPLDTWWGEGWQGGDRRAMTSLWHEGQYPSHWHPVTIISGCT